MATAEQKEKIEKAIADLKNAQTGGEISEIKAKTESLQSAIYELSAAMYQKARSSTAGSSRPSRARSQYRAQRPGAIGTDVDADYEVVNDKK